MNKTSFAFLFVLTPFSALAGTTIQENVNGTVPYVNAGKSADGATSSTALGLQVNGTEMMRVTATGSVGVGTTTPQTMMDVNGQIKSNGKTLYPFGGLYQVCDNTGCGSNNPLTGARSCPSGYTAYTVARIKFPDGSQEGTTLYACF